MRRAPGVCRLNFDGANSDFLVRAQLATVSALPWGFLTHHSMGARSLPIQEKQGAVSLHADPLPLGRLRPDKTYASNGTE